MEIPGTVTRRALLRNGALGTIAVACISVGQPFGKLQDGYNREPPGRGSGLSSGWKERNKERVVENCAQTIA
jgi:hypothetical protein